MIEFRNVQIKYGDFIAVKKLNLKIEKGEFFTLVGPSGCGKTTTLRALVGFNQLSRGEIYVRGKAVSNVPIEERQIGMVFQSYALFPTMSVYENIAFGLKVKKVPRKTMDTKIKRVIEKVNIDNSKLHSNVSELSGGQQQRVALARAIVLEPQILCLDEPLSNLDAKLRVELRLELKRLQRELGITTLYVTHDQEEALTLSDRLAVFNHGFIEQVGTPMAIYNHSESEFVVDFIGEINVLETKMIERINQQTQAGLNENKKGYIRLEKIQLDAQEGYFEFDAKVKEKEYNGLLTKYILDLNGETLKTVQLNNLSSRWQLGDEVVVYINPEDILQY